MLSLLAGLALAGPLDGWEDSRWLIEIEETTPVHLAIAGPDRNPALIRALQIQAVLHCKTFEMAGKKAGIAKCQFAEMSVRASPQAPPGDRLPEYEAGIKNLEAAMETGAVELKLKEDGRVQSMDILAPPKTDEFVARAMLSVNADLLSGFSLQRADVPAGSPWDEKNSTMIRAATQPLGNGLTKIRHQPLTQDGVQLIQSTGDGTFTSPYLSWAAGQQQLVQATAAAGGQYGSGAAGAMMPERLFDAVFNSITVEGSTGPFQERIWNLSSTPKQDALNIMGFEETPLWASGHIRRLTADEKPDLGGSGLVSAPGAAFPDLPPWTPLQPAGG